MTRVWKWNRPVTVREVLEDLQQERSIAYTTVMTVLDNLHQKGWVRREAEGRAYRYEAVSTRAAYAAALMNDAWSQSDNPAAALVAFFGMMSEEQRLALRDAVRMVQGPETDEPTPPSDTRGVTGTDTAGTDTRSADTSTDSDKVDTSGSDTAAPDTARTQTRATQTRRRQTPGRHTGSDTDPDTASENPGSAQDPGGR
ncbi:BlaI/MecI/CopY family transcriptional regulator [Streptomyces sp. uw30]|uniref:BlaI/MecI/CopY family transcriptional regulator n=1 Tax=Streptomyces sp. uw30 TaxID=1828179 RepID=UPI0021C58C44|nr:BlaI/MecI/CopY family transcriptional regulator [Streptomyces sp. uw30]